MAKKSKVEAQAEAAEAAFEVLTAATEQAEAAAGIPPAKRVSKRARASIDTDYAALVPPVHHLSIEEQHAAAAVELERKKANADAALMNGDAVNAGVEMITKKQKKAAQRLARAVAAAAVAATAEAVEPVLEGPDSVVDDPTRGPGAKVSKKLRRAEEKAAIALAADPDPEAAVAVAALALEPQEAGEGGEAGAAESAKKGKKMKKRKLMEASAIVDAVTPPQDTAAGRAAEVVAGSSDTKKQKKQSKKAATVAPEATAATVAETVSAASVTMLAMQAGTPAGMDEAGGKNKASKKRKNGAAAAASEQDDVVRAVQPPDAAADGDGQTPPVTEAPPAKKQKKDKKDKEARTEQAAVDVSVGGAAAADEPAVAAGEAVDGLGMSPLPQSDSEGKLSNGKIATGARAFQRVKAEEWLNKKGSWNNSYEATFGQEGWGFKAQQILGAVRGKDFRHEKTKKKRGSYKGGLIDPAASCSYKFESDDDA